MHDEDFVEIGGLVEVMHEALPSRFNGHHDVAVDVRHEMHHRVTQQMARVEDTPVLPCFQSLLGVAQPDLTQRVVNTLDFP